MFLSEVRSPSDKFIRESLNHVSVLLSLLCGFPVTVAQVAASCIAQCAEKCKELNGMKRWRKDEKKEHENVERDRETMRRIKSKF